MSRRDWIRKAGLVFCIVVFTWLIVYFVSPTSLPATSAEVGYIWMQMALALSGPDWNWLQLHYNRLLFSIATTSHIVLNIGPFFAIVLFGISIVRDRRKAMILAQTLKLRDTNLKAAIRGLAPEDATDQQRKQFDKKLEDIFASADGQWIRQLEIAIGEPAAKEVQKVMQQPVSTGTLSL